MKNEAYRIQRVREAMAAKRTDSRERFESKINRDGPNGCWVWTGSYFNSGYGQFAIRAEGKFKAVKASRQAWRYFRNEEPGEMQVLHKCDNKACVNPDHLYLGTHQQNMRDSAERGTHCKGERSHKFKRYEGLIDRIRDLRRARYPIEWICEYLNIGVTTYYRWTRAA